MNTYELLMSAYIRMQIFYLFLIVICKLKNNFLQWNFLLVVICIFQEILLHRVSAGIFACLKFDVRINDTCYLASDEGMTNWS